MSTVVVTGSAGGIGAALRSRLESGGHEVVGVDVRDADVVADLSTPEGRRAAVARATEACGGVADGVVVAAGLLAAPGPTVVSVNYFGAVEFLDGMRPALSRAEAPAAVALASNSATCQPGYPVDVAEACGVGDEAEARALAERDADGVVTYPATKLALARWVRRVATSDEWIGAGITLNAVAPGVVDTPMTHDQLDVVLGLGEIFPVPARRPGRPEEVAGLIAYLLGPEARFFCGSWICMDGGTDAALRADDWPRPI